MVRSLSANSLGIGAWATPLTNGAPFTNISTITIEMAPFAIDSIDSTESSNNGNPAQLNT
jgi:hypothetical protein